MLSTQSKRLDPAGSTWRAVLASTGQPESLGMTVKEE
jgi:hypothetical protein